MKFVTEKQIYDYLDSMGFKHSILGFKYLITAINTAIQSLTALDKVTKTLYPAVAKFYDTTSSRAERAIRHAIETCDTYRHGTKPKNSEFIACAVDYFKWLEG